MGVDEIIGELEVIKKIFRKKIITSNYSKIDNNQVSWSNYKSGIYKNIYAKEYETIVRDRQYSFLLADDKGCIQFFYSFNGDILEKVKMAFYPYPVELNETKDDIEELCNDSNDLTIMDYYYDLWNIYSHTFELTVNDDELKRLVADSVEHGNNESAESLLLSRLDYKYKNTNSSHIRVDYDSNVTSHHKCEIQIGAVNYIRFPMKKLISPFMFFEFIFKNVYKPEFDEICEKPEYKTKKSLSKKQSIDFPAFIEENIFIDHI